MEKPKNNFINAFAICVCFLYFTSGEIENEFFMIFEIIFFPLHFIPYAIEFSGTTQIYFWIYYIGISIPITLVFKEILNYIDNKRKNNIKK